MEYQQFQDPIPAQSQFPPVPTGPLMSAEVVQSTTIDLDTAMLDNDRSQRAASVLSGMSAEDMEAAETLNSLHARFHSPPQVQRPPTHLQTTTSYDNTQPEPLLSLLTSQHPIAATLINGSLSAYKTTQSYIPGAYFVERNVGLPLAGTIGRVTGVEGGLRWALQRRESSDQPQGQRKPDLAPTNESSNGIDVEKGFGDRSTGGHMRRSSQLSFAESLPAYDEAGRSPPYQEQQLVLQSRERQPPPGWRAQLMITTSGLGIAMRDESLQSLRYCLSWLNWANQRLDSAIQKLKDLLHRWNDEGEQNGTSTTSLHMSGSSTQERDSSLSALIAAVKLDVLSTLKQVVEVVSNYAGGALPDNARSLVHRHLTSLPQRFSLASAISSNSENGNEAASSARRVMVLAQEGLDMMSQVSRVVNDTLVSAESWCEKLGKGRPQAQGQDMKMEDNGIHPTRTGRDERHDVKMEM